MTGGFLKGNQVHCRRKLLNKPFVVCGRAANSPSWLPGISKRVRFCNPLKGQRPQIPQATHVLIGRTLERAQTVKKKKKKICLQCRRSAFDPWVWKIPWRREWVPNPVFLPGESNGQRSLTGCSPRGCKGSDTTEQLTPSFRKEQYIYLKLPGPRSARG